MTPHHAKKDRVYENTESSGSVMPVFILYPTEAWSLANTPLPWLPWPALPPASLAQVEKAVLRVDVTRVTRWATARLI